MIILIFWIICGVIGALVSSSRGVSTVGGFLLGLLLGPLGVIITFFLGGPEQVAEKELLDGKRKRCPRCAETVLTKAAVCRHCGYQFEAWSMGA